MKNTEGTWGYWLDLDSWTIKEAIRLTACSPGGCIRSCIADASMYQHNDTDAIEAECSGDDEFSFRPACGKRNVWKNVMHIYHIVKNSHWYTGQYDSVSPLDYIQWACAKKTIRLPKQMKQWYDRNRKDGGFTTLAETLDKLDAAQARIAELEAQLASKAGCDGTGLPTVVCGMRRQQRTDEEIAAYLYDDNAWCSQAQVGALLHPETTRVQSASMQQRARRLLGLA